MTGIESTDVIFSMLVARKSGYYIWKVMVPLYIITLLVFTIFFFPTSDLGDRLNITITLLLTTAATQYVVSADLPKVDFLIAIDKIILLTFLLNVLAAAASVFSYKLPELGFDKYIGTTLFCSWIVLSAALLFPAVRLKEKQLAAWVKDPTFRTFNIGRK